MSSPQRKHAPWRVAAGKPLSGRSMALPRNWRQRLPAGAQIYTKVIEFLGRPNKRGWASGRCPFHEDKNSSLGVQLLEPNGGWKCFAGCGSGDLISFCMKLNNLSFASAVRTLLKEKK